MENKDINFFGVTTFRNQRKKFGIKPDDRRRHMYLIGKTGMGKTVALKNMAIQDIQNGKGIGFVDPHGEAAEELLEHVPQSRVNDVVYFNPADRDYPIAFNIMERVGEEHRHLVAGGLMGVFKKIWPDVWSARMEYILNNCILALLECEGTTLLGVNRMMADADYRKKIVDKVTDPVVKAFWTQEFARYNQRYEVEATAAIQNKIGQFISAPLIRNIIGQVKTAIDMRKVMDEEKILIANLSKGRIGEDSSRLLGALLITKLQLAAMQRVDTPEEERKDFFLYVDEFQNFATESFVNVLSEARKYRLDLILGHQYITQMDETVRDAVFGNIGTLVSFRVGAEDAEFLEREFIPDFIAQDLVNLGKYNVYVKLMIDGIAGRPFSAETLPPFPVNKDSNPEKIIKVSRERYGTPRTIVEEKISKWAQAINSGAEKPSFNQGFGTVLYDAKCVKCGKDTKVIFPPDGKRPTYCKSCLKKMKKQNGEEEKREEKAPDQQKASSLEEAIRNGHVPFNPAKREEEEKKRARKEVDRKGLKEIIAESLGRKTKEQDLQGKDVSDDAKKGILKPGDSVKF